ncbi:MAG: ribosome silencing factor [Bacteroidota bacterium]
MPAKKKLKEIPEITDVIVKGMIEKKGKDILAIDFSSIQNTLFKGFVICHGNSRAQVEAIADSVEKEVSKETGQKPSHREGFVNAEWVLLDYFDTIVHIFQEESRGFYQIEKLWADAKIRRFDSE